MFCFLRDRLFVWEWWHTLNAVTNDEPKSLCADLLEHACRFKEKLRTTLLHSFVAGSRLTAFRKLKDSCRTTSCVCLYMHYPSKTLGSTLQNQLSIRFITFINWLMFWLCVPLLCYFVLYFVLSFSAEFVEYQEPSGFFVTKNQIAYLQRNLFQMSLSSKYVPKQQVGESWWFWDAAFITKNMITILLTLCI